MVREWRQMPGNEDAYDRLREVVATGEAIAFVGAGASAGLYPLWTELIRRLADEAVKQGVATDADRVFWLAAGTKPQQAVRGIKQALGDGAYAEALRRNFDTRKGLDGNYFTPLHGRLVRLAFRGFVTTNYDLGLVHARNMLRQDPRSSFATWKEQDEIHRWLTDAIFRERPCPILFAHGVYDRSDTIVLGADEYREAYKNDPYAQLFDKLWGQSRLVFAGFGFSDPWLDFLAELVITQVAARKSAAPQHLAIIGLKEEDAYTSERRRYFRDAYNAYALFYPISVAPEGAEDHAALLGILDALAGEDGTTFTHTAATWAFKTRNVVLVHGAFAEGSSWSGVVERLQAAGLQVVAVQIPLTSLADDVKATKRALAMQDGPTVLVGHSYGGTVISEVGVDPKVTGLVYVAALAPEPGEDVSELAQQFPTPPLFASIRVSGGFAQLDEAGFIANYAQDVPPARARVLAASQAPIEQNLFGQKTTVAAWKNKPSWYAVSTMDRVIDPDLERFFAKRMNAYTVEMDASHASPVSQPNAIAELIKLAARASGRIRA